MKKRMFGRLLALALLVLLTACGAAPAASPEPGPFDASPCVELSVKFFSHTAEQFRLGLQAEKGKWTLRTVDYPGAILEPGTDVLAAGEGREDLPFDRFLTVLRAYGAESWDGWKTAGGEETFSMELLFADGTRYSASGGEAPAGFAAFKEMLEGHVSPLSRSAGRGGAASRNTCHKGQYRGASQQEGR